MKPFSPFLKENKSILLEGAFLSVIEHTPHTVHIKETNTGKYVFANQKYALLFDKFNSEDQLIGLTLEDLPFHKDDKLFEEHIASVKAQDEQVCYWKLISRERRLFPDKEGILRIDDTVKMPLLGQNQKVVAVMTLGCSIIPNLKLEQIFDFYLKHYASSKKSIAYFLKFLKIEHFFFKLPSKRELHVLLELINAPSHKLAAQNLRIKKETVSFYLKSLKKKLKIDYLLEHLLFYLRSKNYDML